MKKLVIILGVAALLCLALAAQTMAAPSASVKYTGVVYGPFYVSVPKVELGVALSDYFSLILQGGPTFFQIPPVGATVSGGLRCYLIPEGFRPFVTLYGGLWFWGPTVRPFAEGTVGLEYLADGGFRLAGEVGLLYINGDLPFTYSLSMGYSF